MKPLTAIAHEKINEHSLDGAVAVDATVGNGQDTRFLAEQVGLDGVVYGFDVQSVALEKAQTALGPKSSRVKWIHDNHSNLAEHVAPSHQGKIAAVMFNLGYLPGGELGITTKPETTSSAIKAGIELLEPKGIMTIISYRGHLGGKEEYQAVQNLIDVELKNEIRWESFGDTSGTEDSPVLFVVRKNVVE